MDKIVVALVTLVVAVVWCAHLEGEVRKDYAKAGYIVIDKKPYRIVPVND